LKINVFELGLTPSQIMLAKFIGSNPGSCVEEYVTYLPMSERTIRRGLKKLVELGVVEVIEIEEKGRKIYSVPEYGGL
jgi:DNA-binding transcriptional ArsR family regulator